MTEYAGPINTTLPAFFDPTREQEGYLSPTPVNISFLEWLAATDREQQKYYKTYRRYYDGEHDTMLTDRMRAFLELADNIDFRLNICPVVVDVWAERLNVTGFESKDTTIGGKEGILWEWWEHNRMDAKQKDLYTAAGRDGDGYILIEWDSDLNRPRWEHELAYDGDDGPSGLMVRYDEERRGVIKYAIKKWRVESGHESGVTRMNVYTADMVRKYVTGRGGKWELVEEIPWLDGNGRPLGVPVAHFKDARGGSDFGKSRLDDIIPCQNALNKCVIDELAAADVAAFDMLTKVGGEDPEGLQFGPGRILWESNPDVKWGSIRGGGFDTLINLVGKWVMRAAQISRIPLSYFQITGQVSSSDSQKADDKGLVSQVESSAESYGNGWEDVCKISLRLSNAFNKTSFKEDQIISTQWASFDRVDRNEKDRKEADTNKLKAEAFQILLNQSVQRVTAALLAGYTQEQADAMAQVDRVLASDQI